MVSVVQSALDVVDVVILVLLEDFLVCHIRGTAVYDGHAASGMRGASCLLLLLFLLMAIGAVGVAFEVFLIKDRPLILAFTVIVFVCHALEGIVLHTVLHGIANGLHTLAHFPYDYGHEAGNNKEEKTEEGQEEFHRLWSSKV